MAFLVSDITQAIWPRHQRNRCTSSLARTHGPLLHTLYCDSLYRYAISVQSILGITRSPSAVHLRPVLAFMSIKISQLIRRSSGAIMSASLDQQWTAPRRHCRSLKYGIF